MFTIGESQIKVVTGQKSQTVNVIADHLSVDAGHAWIVRIKPPSRFIDDAALVAQQFPTVEALVDYLCGHHDGQVERSPSDDQVSRGRGPTLPTVSVVGSDEDNAADDWTARAVVLVECAINQLVLEFAELPFLHRVEHSVHCELYGLLTANPGRSAGRTSSPGACAPSSCTRSGPNRERDPTRPVGAATSIWPSCTPTGCDARRSTNSAKVASTQSSVSRWDSTTACNIFRMTPPSSSTVKFRTRISSTS